MVVTSVATYVKRLYNMTFTPDRIPISNVTQANPAVVTTSTNHNLSTGQVVRINVPQGWGMTQLNKTVCIITVLNSTNFSLQKSQTPPYFINVDTTQFSAFTTPSKPKFTAEVLPIGSGPTPVTNTVSQTVKSECEDLLDDAVFNDSISPIPF